MPLLNSNRRFPEFFCESFYKPVLNNDIVAALFFLEMWDERRRSFPLDSCAMLNQAKQPAKFNI
jgi:hypothetical protein